MSNFGKGYKLKVFGTPEPIQITNKVSKNQLKKQQKQGKKQENINMGVSNKEFELMMAENDNENPNPNTNPNSNTNPNAKITYDVPELNNIKENVKKLLEKNVLGQDLVKLIGSNDPNPIELLGGLLKSQLDSSNIYDLSWFGQEKYGLGLKKLFESNIHDQTIGLLMIQNYCSIHLFPKIQYKNKLVYLLKVLFQLFFTYDIFEEEAYWKWQEYVDNNNKFNDELKKILLVQTSEFFIILKTVFTDEDYENEESNNKESNNKESDKKESDKKESDKKESDNSKDDLEEEDFNLDDL
jgi:hypothetical protein